jgi:NAD(P)-dependent dehydrogenase (short-subunit alcohol dehydrogenase family)
MVQAFAQAGMHVVAADIEVATAEAVVSGLPGDTKAVAVGVDVSDWDSVVALADRAFEEFGEVHVLCNNAGVMLSGPFFDKMRPEDWHWMFSVNVFGVIHGLYAFVPRMLKQASESHIVNTASMAAFSPAGPGHANYTASKNACNVVTESLRIELADTGIGVSGLYPGPVATNIITSQRNRPARFGEPMNFDWETDLVTHSEEMSEQLLAELMDPLDVGLLVRDAIVANQPWIFTHPQWLDRTTNADRSATIASSSAWCEAWRQKHLY